MMLNFTTKLQKIQWSNPVRAPIEGSVGEVFAQFTVDSEWEGRTITVVFSNEEGGAPLPEPVLWTGEPVKVPAAVLVDGVLRVGLVGVKEGKTLTTRYMERGVPVYRSGGTGGEAIDPDPALWEQVLSEMTKSVNFGIDADSSSSTMVDYFKDEAMKEVASQITESTTSSLAQSLYEQMKRNYEV